MPFKDKAQYYYSYLNSAVKVLQSYNGCQPFAGFLKAFFSQNKKFGSRDRKQISNLCYAYFRLGKSFAEVPIEQRILLGLACCKAPLEEKWMYIIDKGNLDSAIQPTNIFPWKTELSNGIDAIDFEASFLIQPDLFLRIRPGKKEAVLQKLQSAKIDFLVEENAVRLNNTVKAGTVLDINKEVVVQDLSSQKAGELLQLIKNRFSKNKIIEVYDCCAASGGKAVLVKDILNNIELTVSDIRASIIENLKKRFRESGITNYRAFIADLTKPVTANKKYDLVIADVPCTGSGTWARTPEQLYYFKEEKITTYATLQKNILNNICHLVQPGGYLLYITCSVFSKENEEQVTFVQAHGFELIEQKLIKGYETKADTMFGALLQKVG